MTDSIRVFVNDRGVEVPRGSVALDAVRAHDAALANRVLEGAAAVTDGRGIPVDAEAPAVAGTILRVVISARRRPGPADADA